MMLLRLPRLFSIVGAAAFLCANAAQAGNPVGDFFKKVGNSIAHPQHTKPVQRPSKSASTGSAIPKPSPGATAAAVTPAAVASADVPAPTAPPSPTILSASKAAPNNSRRDLPYGIPVPSKPGLVTSPYSPTRGFVDVRGFPSGTEVKDPYTDKVFLVP